MQCVPTKCTVSVGGEEGEAGHASPERVPSRGGTFCPVSGRSLEELPCTPGGLLRQYFRGESSPQNAEGTNIVTTAQSSNISIHITYSWRAFRHSAPLHNMWP